MSIFRMVHLPRPIDSARAYAELRNGVLSVTAPIARDGKACGGEADRVEAACPDRVGSRLGPDRCGIFPPVEFSRNST